MPEPISGILIRNEIFDVPVLCQFSAVSKDHQNKILVKGVPPIQVVWNHLGFGKVGLLQKLNKLQVGFASSKQNNTKHGFEAVGRTLFPDRLTSPRLHREFTTRATAATTGAAASGATGGAATGTSGLEDGLA